MGALRHRRLINWLSMAVALQLAVALVALSARAGRDLDPGADAQFAAGQAQNGSVLAGAKIPKRRTSNRTDAQAAASTSGRAAPKGDAAPGDPLAGGPSTAGPTSGGPTPGGATPGNLTPGSPAPDAALVGPSPGATAAPGPSSNRPAPAAGAATPAAAGDEGHPGTLADPSGDTVVDGSEKPAGDPRADIVRSGAVYGPEAVTFAMQVDRPTDPRTDERWASDSTYAQWDVDTNGDAMPDFVLEYYFVDEDNLGGTVSNAGGGDAGCNVRAVTYSADGYKLTVDPACLGNPTSFSYRATLYYDTNPADENADVVTDVTPNGGWSLPISRLS